jgi:hypothetical protein
MTPTSDTTGVAAVGRNYEASARLIGKLTPKGRCASGGSVMTRGAVQSTPPGELAGPSAFEDLLGRQWALRVVAEA